MERNGERLTFPTVPIHFLNLFVPSYFFQVISSMAMFRLMDIRNIEEILRILPECCQWLHEPETFNRESSLVLVGIQLRSKNENRNDLKRVFF